MTAMAVGEYVIHMWHVVLHNYATLLSNNSCESMKPISTVGKNSEFSAHAVCAIKSVRGTC